MPYKDKDKQRKYQRNWVQTGVTVSVEPHIEPVITKAEQRTGATQIEVVTAVHEAMRPEPQSYNPMMVGYVPPTD